MLRECTAEEFDQLSHRMLSRQVATVNGSTCELISYGDRFIVAEHDHGRVERQLGYCPTQALAAWVQLVQTRAAASMSVAS